MTGKIDPLAQMLIQEAKRDKETRKILVPHEPDVTDPVAVDEAQSLKLEKGKTPICPNCGAKFAWSPTMQMCTKCKITQEVLDMGPHGITKWRKLQDKDKGLTKKERKGHDARKGSKKRKNQHGRVGSKRHQAPTHRVPHLQSQKKRPDGELDGSV